MVRPTQSALAQEEAIPVRTNMDGSKGLCGNPVVRFDAPISHLPPHAPHTLARLLLFRSRIALIERSIGKSGLMSSVDFRWLPEPLVLKDTEPACQDQARSQPKPSLSAHPSARRMTARAQRTSLNRHSSFLFVIPCLPPLPGRPAPRFGKSW